MGGANIRTPDKQEVWGQLTGTRQTDRKGAGLTYIYQTNRIWVGLTYNQMGMWAGLTYRQQTNRKWVGRVNITNQEMGVSNVQQQLAHTGVM